MEFEFEVGDRERHTVQYSFDKWSGKLSIKVDGLLAESDRTVFGMNLVARHRITVGAGERHEVVIERRRKLFLAGFRQMTCRAFVDGQLVGEYRG